MLSSTDASFKEYSSCDEGFISLLLLLPPLLLLSLPFESRDRGTFSKCPIREDRVIFSFISAPLSSDILLLTELVAATLALDDGEGLTGDNAFFARGGGFGEFAHRDRGGDLEDARFDFSGNNAPFVLGGDFEDRDLGGDLEGTLRLICDRVHAHGDVPVRPRSLL